MRYEKAKKLKDTEFKRLCGVKRETFLEMCELVQAVENRKTSGRKAVLLVENPRFADTDILAGVSDNVSFRTRLGIARRTCLATGETHRGHFNQE